VTGPIIRPGSTSVNIITGATDQDFIGIGDSADLPDISAALALKLDVTTAAATYARPDVVVGTGGYATITLAIAACPTNGIIEVRETTTETIVIPKTLTIRWVNGAFLTNSGNGDAIATSIAEDVNGSVADVVLINPKINSAATASTLGTGLALASAGDTVTSTAHGLVAGKQVQLSNIATAVGVSAATTYYVVNPTANTFKLALTPGGSAVDITTSGTADVAILARNGGIGVNLHGAIRWRIHNLRVTNHAQGVWFSATPYPSGQGSHNTIYSAFFSECGIAVNNGGFGNINTIYDLYTHNCSKHYLHGSGLNPNIFGFRAENLGGSTENMIQLDGQGSRIYGLHAEAHGASPALSIGSGAQAAVDGDIYVTTGVVSSIDPGSTTRYSLRLKGTPHMERSYARAQNVTVRGFAGLAATTSFTVLSAVGTWNIRGFALNVAGFIAYGVSDYWTLALYEYNGNTLIGQIGTTVTQAGTWGRAPIKQTLAAAYPLLTDRTIMATFTKVGSAADIGAPQLQIEWEW
jgi:hypothetical protein